MNMHDAMLALATQGWEFANKKRRVCKGLKWFAGLVATFMYFFCIRLLTLHDTVAGLLFLGSGLVWTWVCDMNVRSEWRWEQRVKFWDEQIRILAEGD